MKRNVNLFIKDILENINLIEDSLHKVKDSEFKQNRLLTDATLRRLEIIGEAVKNIPLQFKEKYLRVPWRTIAGFRDVLTHTYFGVSLERVLEIIRRDLPELKKEIVKIQNVLLRKP